MEVIFRGATLNIDIMIVVWNLVTVPIALISMMTRKVQLWSFATRLAFMVAVMGQLAEAILILSQVDRVSGWGNFWFLKDIGIGLVSVALLVSTTIDRKSA